MSRFFLLQTRCPLRLIRILLDMHKTVKCNLGSNWQSPFVFWQGDGGSRYLDVKKSFASALKRAGIRDFHFYDLRHTFASHLVMAGVDLTTVRELLGHKTLTKTLRYSHLAPSHKLRAVDILDSKLNEVCEKEVSAV